MRLRNGRHWSLCALLMVIGALAMTGCSRHGVHHSPVSQGPLPQLKQPVAQADCTGNILQTYQPDKTQTRRAHFGVDFLVCEGQFVIAVADGLVDRVHNDPGFGPQANGGFVSIVHIEPVSNRVVVDLLYSHLSKIRVKTGDRVKRGEILGEAWRPDYEGDEWVPHVHLQQLGSQPIRERDPLKLLSGCETRVRSDALIFPVSC